jgi:hypothetical protein
MDLYNVKILMLTEAQNLGIPRTSVLITLTEFQQDYTI